MLTEFDDYLAHQMADTFDHSFSSDRRFYDRYYFNFFKKTGEFYVITGMAVYPNTAVFDGYSMLTIGNRFQRNLRVSRELEHDRHNSTIGPVKVEILEPLRKIRLVCEENPQNFSYNIVCETLTPPFERRPAFYRRDGRVVINTCHYSQAYRCTGSIVVDGKRYEVTPDEWWGFRDHSWGVRGGGYAREPDFDGTPPPGVRYLGPFFPMQFDDRYIKLYVRGTMETARMLFPWDSGKPPVEIVEVERKNVVMDAELERYKRVDYVLTDEQGHRMEIEVSYLTTCYIKGGGYGGVGTYFFGYPKGKFHMEHDAWDLNQRYFIENRGGGDHLAVLRWGNKIGYGIFEVSDDELRKRPYMRWVAARTYNQPP